MNQELTDEELLYASPEDWAFYIDIIQGLPTMAGKNGDGKDKFGEFIPYHSGPHILRHLREVIAIVNPEDILEIGFNMGHSSAMWLNISDADIVSIDVSEKDETIEGSNYLKDEYPDRFLYYNRHSNKFNQMVKLWLKTGNYFDLGFIDGAHDEQSIINDIQFNKDLKTQYLLFDDWYPRYGETQKAVAKFPELELVKDMNNLRLYRANY